MNDDTPWPIIGIVLVGAAVAWLLMAGRRVPGGLPESIENMPPAVFAAVVARFDPDFRPVGKGAFVRALRCDTLVTESCKGSDPTQTTSVRIEPLANSSRGGTDRLPKHGAVVARIRNEGQLAENRWKLKPGRFVYYLLVLEDDDGNKRTARYHIAEVNLADPSASRLDFATGTMRTCDHEPSDSYGGFKDAADFTTCASAVSGPPTAPMTFSSSSIWKRCHLGCCSTEPQ